MATSSIRISPYRKPCVPALTDTHNDYVPPLDYSFKGVSTFPEVMEEEPRPRNTSIPKSPSKTIESKDKSAMKSDTRSIRLNNNSLENWSGITDTVISLLTNPNTLGWLDVSFNHLTTIDKAILDYPSLTVLYLHGNDIADMKQTDNLSTLQKLRTLTLHGNPIENQFGYRPYTLGRCPNLKNFDFSGVTKSDWATSKTWNILYKAKEKKKKPIELVP
ncbi:Leucine-rich repeat-containing protein 51-like [Oopsacas minuta]|uniref:Leucine-rich repeat-containing protein 51 n=1 Tax=Oopsacas minuta TaxID=111878 RepID=A0AAV7KIR3_9METZ|nr:Leucine-rich repeat-containing protein 51-like [Oopsacas minuta]